MNCLTNLPKKIYRKLFGAYMLSSLLSKQIEDEWTILDVGCGRTSSLKGVEKGAYRVGLDIYRPYILKIRRLSVHDDYVLGDAMALPFKSNSFDCAVATEILEHLTKHDGLRMIKEIERVVKKKILMTTPNGFLPTYAGPDDNPE
jgi:ubiquinone/menaquinone biosynthesis C-methylase UbiE